MRAFLDPIRAKLWSSRYYISRQKLLFLSIGIIGLGLGLVLAKSLCNILSPPDRLSLPDVKAIFWLGIGIVLLGIAGFGVLKPRILWLSIGMIGLGLGLVLAASYLEISILSDIKAILGLGIAMVLLGGIVGFGGFGAPKPKTLWLSAGIIGLGLGLVLAFLLEISILSDIKAIFWLGIGIVLLGVVGFGVLGEPKPRILWLSVGITGLGLGLVLAKPLCNILISPDTLSLSNIKAIFWLGVGIVLLGVVFGVLGEPKPRILWLSVGITGLGLGLVLAVPLLKISSSPDRLISPEIPEIIDMIFWLGIEIVLLGGVVGFGVLGVPKPKTLWLSVGIIGLGLGLVLAVPLLKISSLPDRLISPEIIDMIFWLGIPIIGIGLMLAWVFHERVVAVIGIIVTIVVAILTDLSGGKLLNSVSNIVKNTANIGTTLHYVKTHTSDIDSKLQDVVKKTSGIDSLVDSLVKKTSSIDSLEKYTFGIDTTLQKVEKHTSGIDSLVDSLVKHTSDIDSLVDSLVKKVADHTLDNQTVKELKDRVDQISEELKEAKQAFSVRLLIGTEENLKNEGFLKKKWHRLSDRLSDRLFEKRSEIDSLVTIVPIGKPFPLESAPQKLVGSSGQLDLEALVSHSGKLKKHEYEKIVKRDSTFITFTDPFLVGMHILAVVKRKKSPLSNKDSPK